MSEERTPYLACPTESPALTRRRYQLLAFLARYEAAHGYAATLDEMAAHLGVAAISTVSEMLDGLERLGCVHRARGAERGVRVTTRGAMTLRETDLHKVVELGMSHRLQELALVATAEQRAALQQVGRLLGLAGTIVDSPAAIGRTG